MRSNLVGRKTRPIRNEEDDGPTEYGEVLIRKFRRDQGDERQMGAWSGTSLARWVGRNSKNYSTTSCGEK